MKSPVYGLAIIERKLYKFFGKINLFYGRYVLLFFYVTIMCLVVKPIVIVLLSFYRIMEKLVSTSIVDLIFKRIEGLIFSLFWYKRF